LHDFDFFETIPAPEQATTKESAMARSIQPFETAISDEAWEAAQAKLTPAIRQDSARDFLEALAHRTRTKCTWRELPEHFGRWHKIYVRYAHWEAKGHFKRVRRVLSQRGVDIGQARADAYNAKHAQSRAAQERREKEAAQSAIAPAAKSQASKPNVKNQGSKSKAKA
jgi:transposase